MVKKDRRAPRRIAHAIDRAPIADPLWQEAVEIGKLALAENNTAEAGSGGRTTFTPEDFRWLVIPAAMTQLGATLREVAAEWTDQAKLLACGPHGRPCCSGRGILVGADPDRRQAQPDLLTMSQLQPMPFVTQAVRFNWRLRVLALREFLHPL